MVDVDPAPPSDPSVATINQSPHVAMERAKSAISSRDMDKYVVAHTEDFSYLMVHSLMRVWSLSLLPFMVFPCVCVFDFRVFVEPDCGNGDGPEVRFCGGGSCRSLSQVYGGRGGTEECQEGGL